METITEAISAFDVEKRMFLDRGSGMTGLIKANIALPSKGPERERLDAFIDEFPIVTFVLDTLSIQLRELDQYQSKPPSAKLISIEGYEKPEAVAEDLVRQFQTLPWKYKLTMRLPPKISGILPATIDEFAFNPELRLVRGGAALAEQFPLDTPNEKRRKRIHRLATLLAIPLAPAWEPNALYLQIGVSGFVGHYGGTAPAIEAERILRAFCGLGLALNFLRVEHTYDPVSGR